ncbi:MAG: T9SS type A sorting domain-containing protein, partial [Flavitalea sp.]
MKRILPILFFLLLSVLYSTAQDSRSPVTTTGKIVSLYPNPATSYITFNIPKSFQKGLIISVFNFIGKKISETQTETENTVVSLTDFNRGTYIYHVVDR